ncbi:MAG: hypothetical protein OEU50_05965 [Gammaproteobacteria bacterium]|nr:hypothetical protein [Gammaproteobacteria bacterium]
MKKYFGLGVLLFFAAANASAVDVGVGAKVGINGVGLNLALGLSKRVNLRVAVSEVEIDDEEETITVGDDGAEGDIEAELDVDFGSNAVLLDWHVFNGGFRITAGLFKQTGAVDLSGRLQGSIIVDGQPLAPGDINGDIGGEVKLSDSYQPYLGIGWGRAAGGKGGFSFTADIGLAMLDPEVDFDASVNGGGPNGLDQAELDQRLAEMEADAEEELDDLELWPVLSVGVNYSF